MKYDLYEIIFKISKIIIINIFTFYTSVKIINKNKGKKKILSFRDNVSIFIISCINISI